MEGNKITIPKLVGQSNYELWSLRMRAILIEKNLGSFIQSQLPIGATIEENKALEISSNRALALVQLSLSDGPLLQIRNITTPLEAWNALKNLYSPKGFSSEFLLYKEFQSTTLSTSLNIEDYLNTIKRLIDDLTSRGLILPPRIILAHILNNLTPDYENFTATITQSLRINNTLDLEVLYSNLIDESKRLENRDSDTPTTLNTKISKTTRACTFCSRKGHSKEDCWQRNPEKRPKRSYKEEEEEPISLTSFTL
jgi:hypothetical protein